MMNCQGMEHDFKLQPLTQLAQTKSYSGDEKQWATSYTTVDLFSNYV